MKINYVARVVSGIVFSAAVASSANADVLYKYTAPTADAITTMTVPGVLNTLPYAGSGPLFSFSFKRTGNEIKSMTGAEMHGMNVLFSYAGAATNFNFVYNPDDDEQPFIEFAGGNLTRPSGWDMHGFLNATGVGPMFFESTSSFDFARRRLADGSYVVLSAGIPESDNSQGVWNISQVPEPGSLSMLALAGGLLFASRTRFKRKN